MAIRDWHPGKLLMLWAALVVWMAFLQPKLPQDDELRGWAWILWLVGLAAVFTVTWRWFTGRQRSQPPRV